MHADAEKTESPKSLGAEEMLGWPADGQLINPAATIAAGGSGPTGSRLVEAPKWALELSCAAASSTAENPVNAP